MSNTNMDNTFIAIAVAEVEVGMYQSGISKTTIRTSGLGPCIAILIDFFYSGEKHCILDHYSFGLDESQMTSSEIVLVFLERMMELIKDHVNVSSFEDNKNKSNISHVNVLISGGDIEEGIYIRDSFKLLLENKIQIDQDMMNKDILFLYKNIKNHLIIINPITKILSPVEEEQALITGYAVNFPSLWINYCCKSQEISMGIRWKSLNGKFNLALSNFNFKLINQKIEWEFQHQRINIFKEICSRAELNRINEALLFISNRIILACSDGSSYGVVNRAALYDKNTRSAYSNDRRQQPMVQPGQQPLPPMPYSNVMGSSQPMMSNVILAGGGPMRQKKRIHLTKKVIHEQICSLVPESRAYIELLRLELKLDAVLMRKRLDIQETLKRSQKIKKKLRMFISHQYPVRFDADTTGIDDEQVQYWEMRVEGRLLNDPNTNKYDQGKTKRKFSSFFRSLVIELDKDLYGSDDHLVEWHRTNATVDTDRFQVRRPGDQNVRCTILMVLDHSPPQFQLDSRLACLLSVTNGTLQTIVHAMWQYIKTHKLQDSKEREFINCDSRLRAIFDCSRVLFSDLPVKLNKLILPSKPIIINHTLCLGTEGKNHACYDIDVEVDDPVRDSMRAYLSPKNTHELEELDGKILQCIDSINQLKQSREFYLSFADDPQSLICKWLASQSRDLKLITDSTTGNPEEERRADYYTEQWSYEAVSRYLYNKVQQKRAKLEQTLSIRNA